MKKKENILIIKHGALGDLIQADGIFKSIRAKHKYANIVLMTSKNFLTLMIKSPYINDILIDNRLSFININFYINFFKRINQLNFSKIYDLQNSQRTYIYQKYFLRKSEWVTTKRKDHNVSGIMGLVEMLKKNGLETKDALKPNISWLTTNIKNILNENKIFSKYIVLLPGSSRKHKEKRWPFFGEFAKLLLLKNYQVVVILGPEELELEESMKGIIIFKNMKWSELTGVMKKSYFVIGNDSGPSHIASCLDINGLVLFGDSTSATRSGLKKSKFNTLEVNDLKKLSPDTVFKKMIENLKQI
jgi:ADP-heptose:LPS heptosyltransferase